MEGLELSTSGFGDRRSSQLSYTPIIGQDVFQDVMPATVAAKENVRGQKSSAPNIFVVEFPFWLFPSCGRQKKWSKDCLT